MAIAHRAEDGREQRISEHAENVAALCAAFAAPFGAEEVGRELGLSHDIGKYSRAFQRRISGENIQVDHSTAGAWECFQRGQLAAAFCVAGHHGRLPELGTSDDLPDLPTLCGRMNRARQGRLEDYAGWREEISLAELPPQPPSKPLDDFFFVKMLYSCLVDADALDTERFMLNRDRSNLDTSMSELDRRFEKYVREKFFPPSGSLNVVRCAILENCLVQGERQKPGLFTLTVPTGGGKTAASIAFALRHAKKHGLRKVIYVIPYTSIIEQTADEFRKFIGAENVLEHHSGVSYDTDENGDVRPEDRRYIQATENWDMPVVVTTAVQFFEPLYADRPSKCRKLHNLAGSVIVFDEAQMLPLPYLRPCVYVIAKLVDQYGASAVLCTATQPVLGPVFQEFLPGRSAVELCPPKLASDNIFRRVTFRKVGRVNWEQLADMMNRQNQTLCVVNSRKSAKEVYGRLAEEGRFHLSTLMFPAHRRAVLEEIRRRLTCGLTCRVVSTSLIEAGVDVDFPTVFREEAGLDSIIQAAGRCNREGKRAAEESVVTVFQADIAAPAQFETAIGAAHAVMKLYDDLLDPEAVSLYFQELRDLSGKVAQDRKNIIGEIEKGTFPFRKVAEEFHLIENVTRTIFIPDRNATDLLMQLQRGEVSQALFRKLGQYSVSVYEQHFLALYDAKALKLLPDGESGILIDMELYDKATGLSLDTGGETLLMV